MDSELRSLQQIVERFDKDFFVKRDIKGFLRVYHHTIKYLKYDLDGKTLLVPYKEPYHVFSMTDTWGFLGKPVKWGSLLIEEKVKSLMQSNREKLFRELEESERKAKESKERSLSNLTENMAYEARDMIKEATQDVVFHQVKSKDNRYKYDKKIKGV